MLEGREYSNPSDLHAAELLNRLLQNGITTDEYRAAMRDIGFHLGERLKGSLDVKKSYCLAVTVEDADFLAAGVVQALKDAVHHLYIACFWNERTEIAGRSLAPILNSYFEEGFEKADEVIVLKSIMAGACVVKTNVTVLFEKLNPSAIHIVAPVMHKDSRSKLESEFPESTSRLFSYTYLAVDSDYNQERHLVTPGIGGDVYQKLGYVDAKEKNTIIPRMVQERAFA